MHNQVALPQLVWVRHSLLYLPFANPLRIVMSKFARTSVSNVDKAPPSQWGPCIDLCSRVIAGSEDLGTEAGEVDRFVGCRRHVCDMFVCDMFVTPQCDLCPLRPLAPGEVRRSVPRTVGERQRVRGLHLLRHVATGRSPLGGWVRSM